jgi:hypothetical protein
LGKQVAAAAETAMSNWNGAAAAFIDPPMNIAPSASDIAEIPAFRGDVILL